MDPKTLNQIQAAAKGHLARQDDELYSHLLRAMEGTTTTSTAQGQETLKGEIYNLSVRLARQSEASQLTFEAVVRNVVDWAEQNGLEQLIAQQTPASLLSALVYKVVLASLPGNPTTDAPPPEEDRVDPDAQA